MFVLRNELIKKLNDVWFVLEKYSSHSSDVVKFEATLDDLGISVEPHKYLDCAVFDYEIDSIEVPMDDVVSKEDLLDLLNDILVDIDGEVTHSTGVKPKFKIVDGTLDFLSLETERSAKELYEEIRFSDDIALAQMESAGNYVTYYKNLDELVENYGGKSRGREEILFDLEFVDQFDLKDMKKDFILVDKAGVDGGKVFNGNHSINEVIEYMREDQDMSPFVRETSAHARRERNHSFFKERE